MLTQSDIDTYITKISQLKQEKERIKAKLDNEIVTYQPKSEEERYLIETVMPLAKEFYHFDYKYSDEKFTGYINALSDCAVSLSIIDSSLAKYPTNIVMNSPDDYITRIKILKGSQTEVFNLNPDGMKDFHIDKTEYYAFLLKLETNFDIYAEKMFNDRMDDLNADINKLINRITERQLEQAIKTEQAEKQAHSDEKEMDL